MYFNAYACFLCVRVSVFSRFLDPVAGQEGLAQVLLGLLDAVLSGQSQRVTQCLTLKYPFEGLFKKAILQSTLLFSDATQHLPATIGRLIERTWIWKEGSHIYKVCSVHLYYFLL